MTQNQHNAVIHLGHQNGTVTLWTPNLSFPAVRLLAHLGPVVGVSVDPSTGGRYMATSGQDGSVKVWDCRNWKGAVRTWQTRGGGADVEWSQRGVLAVASGGSVNVNCISPTKVYYCADPWTFLHLRHTQNRPFRRPSRALLHHLYTSPTPSHTAHSPHSDSALSKISSP